MLKHPFNCTLPSFPLIKTKQKTKQVWHEKLHSGSETKHLKLTLFLAGQTPADAQGNTQNNTQGTNMQFFAPTALQGNPCSDITCSRRNNKSEAIYPSKHKLQRAEILIWFLLTLSDNTLKSPTPLSSITAGVIMLLIRKAMERWERSEGKPYAATPRPGLTTRGCPSSPQCPSPRPAA